jgi:hypothetical protein
MHPIVRAVLVVALGISVTVMLAKGVVVLASGYDLNLVSGVWLALAADAREGLFYRGLSDAGAYGGTRYFPLLFLMIAAGMALGLSAITSGQVVSVLSAALLATTAWVLLRRAGVGALLALAGAVLALAPYFVQQTILSIRAEPLAAACALWGAAAVADRLGPGAWRRWLLAAAVAFTLAVAAKPTAGYAAVAGILALAFARRWRDAGALLAACLAGWSLLLGGIWIASAGRAPEGFAALALGGEAPGALVGAGLFVWPVQLVLTSWYLTAVFALTLAGFVMAPRDAIRLPGLFLVCAALAAAVALATPGTIMTNQFVEPYVAAVVCLAWMTQARRSLRALGPIVLSGLLVWAATHEARRLARLLEDGAPAAARASRADVADAVQRCGGPVLAESPLVPIVAGQRPVLLDPFAFRVAALARPALADELIGRLGAREFPCVFLEYDPADEVRGRGWYRNVSLGQPVIEALARNYVYRGTVVGHRLYVPGSSVPAVRNKGAGLKGRLLWTERWTERGGYSSPRGIHPPLMRPRHRWR